MADQGGAEVILLHAIDPERQRASLDCAVSRARQQLEAFGAESFHKPDAGLSFSVEVEEGDPPECVLRCAADKNADLIMISSLGHCNLLGGGAARIVNSADCSVWTPGHAANSSYGYVPNPEPKTVLAALDLMPTASELLCFVRRFCDERRIRPELIHSVAMPVAVPMRRFDYEYRDYLIGKGQTGLKWLQQEAGTDYPVCVAPGEIAGLIRGTALRQQADLLIMGRGPAQHLRGRLNGHSYSILRECPCPVLSI